MANGIYLLRPDTHDHRDLVLDIKHPKRPQIVDLSVTMKEVFDQGQLGSCTANAIIGLMDFLFQEAGIAIPDELSRLFLYWYERYLEGTVDQDAGAMIRDGMKVAQKYGVALEKFFPYIISHFTDKPTQEAVENALNYKLDVYHRVTKLDTLLDALAHRKPVVFGMSVYESFESAQVARTGLVPVPNVHRERLLGGHAILAVGYNELTKLVKVRNSWSKRWGQNGYCEIPYEVFENRSLVSDMWTGEIAKIA